MTRDVGKGLYEMVFLPAVFVVYTVIFCSVWKKDSATEVSDQATAHACSFLLVIQFDQFILTDNGTGQSFGKNDCCVALPNLTIKMAII